MAWGEKVIDNREGIFGFEELDTGSGEGVDCCGGGVDCCGEEWDSVSRGVDCCGGEEEAKGCCWGVNFIGGDEDSFTSFDDVVGHDLSDFRW